MRYVSVGDYMFSFDLQNGCHYTDLFFLTSKNIPGFLVALAVKSAIFFNHSALFQLDNRSVYFSKIMCPLVKHWRSKEINCGIS